MIVLYSYSLIQRTQFNNGRIKPPNVEVREAMANNEQYGHVYHVDLENSGGGGEVRERHQNEKCETRCEESTCVSHVISSLCSYSDDKAGYCLHPNNQL